MGLVTGFFYYLSLAINSSYYFGLATIFFCYQGLAIGFIYYMSLNPSLFYYLGLSTDSFKYMGHVINLFYYMALPIGYFHYLGLAIQFFFFLTYKELVIWNRVIEVIGEVGEGNKYRYKLWSLVYKFPSYVIKLVGIFILRTFSILCGRKFLPIKMYAFGIMVISFCRGDIPLPSSLHSGHKLIYFRMHVFCKKSLFRYSKYFFNCNLALSGFCQ